MRPHSFGMKIPLPAPEVRTAQMQEAIRTGLLKAAQTLEPPDPKGAIVVLLESVGFLRGQVSSGDTESRERISALADKVFSEFSHEPMSQQSARRMVDRMVQEVDTDWKKRHPGTL